MWSCVMDRSATVALIIASLMREESDLFRSTCTSSEPVLPLAAQTAQRWVCFSSASDLNHCRQKIMYNTGVKYIISVLLVVPTGIAKIMTVFPNRFPKHNLPSVDQIDNPALNVYCWLRQYCCVHQSDTVLHFLVKEFYKLIIVSAY